MGLQPALMMSRFDESTPRDKFPLQGFGHDGSIYMGRIVHLGKEWYHISQDEDLPRWSDSDINNIDTDAEAQFASGLTHGQNIQWIAREPEQNNQFNFVHCMVNGLCDDPSQQAPPQADTQDEPPKQKPSKPETSGAAPPQPNVPEGVAEAALLRFQQVWQTTYPDKDFPDDVGRAFKLLTRVYHPDKIKSRSAQEQIDFLAIYQALNRDKDILKPRPKQDFDPDWQKR
tara:strand:- start:9 stop:695 length:687 start_codon:yes stop_codon:yes gene_type:complete